MLLSVRWNMVAAWVSPAANNSNVPCQVPDATLSVAQYSWQRQNLLSPCLLSTNLRDYVSFLSSAACFASRTACYYEDFLLYPIKGKKGEGLPLEFTYSECQCHKSAVFSTSLPAVTDVKVAWRPSNKFYHHVVTRSDLRELYLSFSSTFQSGYFTTPFTLFRKKKKQFVSEATGWGERLMT